MKTTTPKRKRGQHAKRHPWLRAFNALPWDAFSVWRNSKPFYGALISREKLIEATAFFAGYRAGKGAK